jgi:uncharacterized protein involved in outer membrane biogenesis
VGQPSNWRRWGRVARFCAWFAAGLIAAGVAAALVLPVFLDTPAVKAELQLKLSAAVQGKIAWEDLSIRVLPSPRGIVRKARIEIPGSLEVNAEQLAVRLAFWPLLRGRVEIVSLDLSRPVIRLDIAVAPDDRDEARAKEDDAEPDLAMTWRSTAGGIAGIVRRFAPETVLSVEGAQLEFSAPGILPIALHDVSVRAQTGRSGMDLDASLAGTHWSRVKLSARVQFADLSGQADVEISGLKPQPWLDYYLAKSPIRVAVPESDLRFQARVDGKTELDGGFELRTAFLEVMRGTQRVRVPDLRVKGRIEARGDGVRVMLDDVGLGVGRLEGGTLHYSARSGAATLHARFDLDTAQAMEHARRLAPEAAAQALAEFQPEGRAQGSVSATLGRADWRVAVDVVKSNVAVTVRNLPGPVSFSGGAVDVDRRSVKARGVAISMPAGKVLVSTLQHSLKDGATEGSAEFDLDLPNSMELVRSALPEANRDALSVIQSIAGRARGTAKLALSRKNWSAEVNIAQSDARVQVRDLPGPAGLAGGSAHITANGVKIDRAVLSLLDATATASATISDFREGPSVRGSLAEGAIGEQFLDWVWKLAQIPPRLMLKTPVQLAAPSFAWGPKKALDVQATARIDSGPSVAVELGWTPEALDIRRAAIKDERSDAVMTARIAGPLVQGKFSGTVNSTSIASLLKSGIARGESMSGDFSVSIHREDPRQSSADGSLKGEKIDLAWLIGHPVRIDRIDLAVDGETLRIGEATVDWAGQRATLRGNVTRSERGPVINAQIESPGLNIDALREPKGTAKGPKPASETKPPKAKVGASEELSRPWPLPVTGRIEIRSDFVQSGRHKVAPLAATLVLEERRAHVDLTQADLCGISLPLTLEATPQGYSVSARIAAQKQQLEQSAHCLSGEGVLISGPYDLQADISTQGKAAELLRNLKGTVRADARDGRVMKFAFLGNILSMGNIASLMKADGPKLDAQGFPYRRLLVAGRFGEGRFFVDEGAFHSDALGLAANGWIALDRPESRLTVLVAPFSRLDEIVRKVPLVGYIIGGAFTSVPIGVSGDIRDPLVVPLGPGAVTSEVLGIFERTLKLPAKLVAPLEGSREPAASPDSP